GYGLVRRPRGGGSPRRRLSAVRPRGGAAAAFRPALGARLLDADAARVRLPAVPLRSGADLVLGGAVGQPANANAAARRRPRRSALRAAARAVLIAGGGA